MVVTEGLRKLCLARGRSNPALAQYTPIEGPKIGLLSVLDSGQTQKRTTFYHVVAVTDWGCTVIQYRSWG